MNFLEKNNWWTKKSDLKNISENIQIEYVLNSWKIWELKKFTKKFWLKKIKNIFEKKIEKNIFFKEKRKKFLKIFFEVNNSKLKHTVD